MSDKTERVQPVKPKTKKPRNEGKHGRPTYNQAQKIIAKFGGERAMADAMGMSRISIYRWQYRAPYGSNGMIPSRHIEAVNTAARIWGIVLTERDWMPERIRYSETEDAYRVPFAPEAAE